jgi:tetratricopeptide (TPR) repeat protein
MKGTFFMSRFPCPAAVILILAATVLFASYSGAQQVRDPLRPDAPPVEPAVEQPEKADLSQANEKVAAGDFSAAQAILAPMLETFPDDPALLLMLGEIRLALGQPDQALPALQHAAEIEPERLRLQFQLGSALAALGRNEPALAAFRQEMENNDNPEIRVLCLLNRSFLLQNLKRFEEAAAELVQVAELDPTKAQVYGDAASLYIQAGNPVEAQKVLAAGEPIGFRSAQHAYSLGAAFYKGRDYEAAAAAYRNCLEIKPSFYKAERGLGLALEKSGKEDEAVAHFRKYLELKPDARDREKILEAIGSD